MRTNINVQELTVAGAADREPRAHLPRRDDGPAHRGRARPRPDLGAGRRPAARPTATSPPPGRGPSRGGRRRDAAGGRPALARPHRRPRRRHGRLARRDDAAGRGRAPRGARHHDHGGGILAGSASSASARARRRCSARCSAASASTSAEFLRGDGGDHQVRHPPPRLAAARATATTGRSTTPHLVAPGVPLDAYAVAAGRPVAEAHLFQHLMRRRARAGGRGRRARGRRRGPSTTPTTSTRRWSAPGCAARPGASR